MSDNMNSETASFDDSKYSLVEKFKAALFK
jgi:hypothetical protein